MILQKSYVDSVIKKHFFLLSMLKMAVMFNVFVETIFSRFFDE